jgi:hypothetical protein
MLVLIANQIYLILLAKSWENGLKVTLTKDMAPVKKKKKKTNSATQLEEGLHHKS